MRKMTWRRVLGRVSFINCDPVFHGLKNDWKILAAPPSWLTGHLLRRDCITAPIPASDYAKNQAELSLLSEIGIVGREEVGSVLLFGNRPIESMRDIAVPTDSSTSKMLLSWILRKHGLDPKLIEMGPDIDSMLKECDGALIIGDRAILASISHKSSVLLDLSEEWKKITGLPMVFGVFAARRDSDESLVSEARQAMLTRYSCFLNDPEIRESVISDSSKRVRISEERIASYYDNEVSNILDNDAVKGLMYFLEHVCDCNEEPNWI